MDLVPRFVVTDDAHRRLIFVWKGMGLLSPHVFADTRADSVDLAKWSLHMWCKIRFVKQSHPCFDLMKQCFKHEADINGRSSFKTYYSYIYLNYSTITIPVLVYTLRGFNELLPFWCLKMLGKYRCLKDEMVNFFCLASNKEIFLTGVDLKIRYNLQLNKITK